MTNYEKLRKRYSNWTPSPDRIIYCYGVEKKTGDLKTCNELDCANCVFNEPLEEDCGPITEKWLDQEAEI